MNTNVNSIRDVLSFIEQREHAHIPYLSKQLMLGATDVTINPSIVDRT